MNKSYLFQVVQKEKQISPDSRGPTLSPQSEGESFEKTVVQKECLARSHSLCLTGGLEITKTGEMWDLGWRLPQHVYEDLSSDPHHTQSRPHLPTTQNKKPETGAPWLSLPSCLAENWASSTGKTKVSWRISEEDTTSSALDSTGICTCTHVHIHVHAWSSHAKK